MLHRGFIYPQLCNSPAAQGRIYDFHNDVRVILDFRDWPVLQYHLVRPFENNRAHGIFRHYNLGDL